MKNQTAKTNRIDAISARAGEITNMGYVLAISMVLSTSTMSLAWIIPALAN